MFSKVKPEKIYIYKLKNKQSTLLDHNYITIRILESCFENPSYYEINDYENNTIVKKVYKNECVFEGDYSMGFPVKLKPETIATLKSIVQTVEEKLLILFG